MRELEEGVEPDGRVRRAGAGRPPVEQADPGLLAALTALVDPDSRGDPESPLRWTTKSTSRLADELTGQGHEVTDRTVSRLLKETGYSLQSNVKTIEGRRHPDRDEQFRYINAQVMEFQAAGAPARLGLRSIEVARMELRDVDWRAGELVVRGKGRRQDRLRRGPRSRASSCP